MLASESLERRRLALDFFLARRIGVERVEVAPQRLGGLPSEPFLVLGAPGGSRIINGVLQVILNVVDFHMNVQDAVDWPRFHHQWMPDQLYLEKGISPDTVAILRGMGHKIAPYEGTNPVVARVEAIVNDNGWLQGAADGRGNAKAEGY